MSKAFERYVNFEFYKTPVKSASWSTLFERYVNFEFYKTKNGMRALNDSLRDM